MKNKQYLFILIIFFLGCTPSHQILYRSIDHKYSNVVFSPEIVTKAFDSVKISIAPIDAKILNSETFDNAMRDGNYEKEFFSSIEDKTKELETLSKADKLEWQGKINAIKYIDRLIDNNEISRRVGYLLQKRIWYGLEYGKDGSEISCLSKTDDISSKFNPFKVNNNYLSVFKITFENKSYETKKIKLTDFQVISGEEQLNPLNTLYFETYLKNDPDKILNIYRMYFPNELYISPNQRITKYVAIPAINALNKKLQIQFKPEKNINNFDFDVETKLTNNNYTYESYNLESFNAFGESLHFNHYYVVSFDSGMVYATTNKTIFIRNIDKDLPVSITNVSYDNWTSDVYYVKKENFKFSDYPNHIIKFEIKKQ